MRHVVLVAAFVLGVVGCAATGAPELRVLGVHEALRHDTVFVEVSNPAKRPMRLTRLEYAFAAQGETVATGAVPLAREVPAGSAVVVELPVDSAAPPGPLTLRGKLTTELDEIVRTFSVTAQVKPR